MMLMSGHNIWVSMLAATGAGMLAGLATGIFHTVMGIPAILAGILTQLGLYSVNLKIMGKANQAVNAGKYDLLVSLRNVKGVPLNQNTILIVAIFIVALIAILYWFFGTEIGCSLRATGCNPNMSRAQGINTDFSKVLGLMISNGLVALSSALLAQYQGFADVNMGRGAIVIGLAAVIIGEAIFGKIFRNFALRLLSVALGFHPLLSGSSGCHLDGNRHRPSEAAVCPCCSSLPGCSLLESKILYQTHKTRRCFKCLS